MTSTSAVSSGRVVAVGVLDAEGDAHGCGDADGHGAADDHVADDGGDLLVVGGEDVGLFVGELGLIEEVDAFREPFEGGDHVPLVYDGGDGDRDREAATGPVGGTVRRCERTSRKRREMYSRRRFCLLGA